MKVTNLFYFIFALIILGLIIRYNKKRVKAHYKKYNLDDIVKFDYELEYEDEAI